MNRVVSSALTTLVAGIVDYAGLFPPAWLDMRSAVQNYADYRRSADAWMLGRFVVPVSRLDEWQTAVATLSEADRAAWQGAKISALLSGEYATEAYLITAFNTRTRFGVTIDVAEGRTGTPDAVLATAAAMPDDVMLYCELPHREDPRELLQAVNVARVRAKIRTGGVTADAFPSPPEIVRFLRRAHELGVTTKATAGLHHPLRGDYRLTYAPDAVHGTMYGFLNVFLCAAAIRVGATDAVATDILTLTDAGRVLVHDGAFEIGETVLTSSVLESVRASGVVAFGSCSFREPVDELTSVAWGHSP